MGSLLFWTLFCVGSLVHRGVWYYRNFVDNVHLAGECCYSSTTFSSAESKRGGKPNFPFCVHNGSIPSVLHSQLDLQILHGRLYQLGGMDRRHCSNHTVCGLLLLLRKKQVVWQQAGFASGNLRLPMMHHTTRCSVCLITISAN